MAKKQTQRGEFLELRVAKEVLHHDLNTTSIDAQWNLLGGRMRWIFDKTPNDVLSAVDKAVRNFDIDKIDSILCGQVDSTIGHEGGVPTSLFSTFLNPKLQAELSQCEMLPPSAEKDTKRMEALIRLYREDNLKWVLSGDMVFGKITDKYKSSLSVVLEKLGQATVNTKFAGLAGHSLETTAARLLAAGGNFKMRVLAPPHCGPSSNKTEALNLGPRQLVPLTVEVAKNIGMRNRCTTSAATLRAWTVSLLRQ